MSDPKISRTDTNVMVLGLSSACMLDGILRLYSIVPWIPLPIIFFLIRSLIKRDGMFLTWSAAAAYFGTATYLVGFGGVWRVIAAVMGFGAAFVMMGGAVWREVSYQNAQKIRLGGEDKVDKRSVVGEMGEKDGKVVLENERS